MRPLALGPAPDWTEAFRESLQGALGTWATGMAGTIFSPHREAPVVSQLPMGEGTPASMGWGSVSDGSLARALPVRDG